MASTIKTNFGSGGANLSPGGASGVPSLATALRDIVDDIAGVRPAVVAATDDGVIDGLVAAAPSTPSAQVTGAGNTTWNIDISAGDVVVNGVEKHETAAADFVVHSGSQLLTNGQSVYAWLVEKNVTGTVTTVAVKGTPATTGAQTIPNDAAIQAGVGAGNSYVKIALLLLNRTGDTTVTQSQYNKYREPFGVKALRASIAAAAAYSATAVKG